MSTENTSPDAGEESDLYPTTGPITRRQAIKLGAGAVAGGTALGAGPTDDLAMVDDAEAIAPVILVGAGVVGGVALGAGGYHFLSGGPDTSSIEEAMEFEKHLEFWRQFRTYEMRDKRVLSSLQNDISFAQDVAREQAIFRIMENANSGVSKTEAEKNAQDEITARFVEVEKSLVGRLTTHAIELLQPLEHEGFGGWRNPNGDTVGFSNGEGNGGTYQYLDGSSSTSVSIPYNGNESSNGFSLRDFNYLDNNFGDTDRTIPFVNPPDYESYNVDESNYDYPGVSETSGAELPIPDYADLFKDVHDRHGQVQSEVSNLIDNYYDPAAKGEVDLQFMLSPQAALETVQNADSIPETALMFDSMGVPRATQAAMLDISQNAEGDVEQFEAILAWSLASSDVAWEVGQTIDPEMKPGTIYAAGLVEQDDGTTEGRVVELTEPFKITSTEDGGPITFRVRKVAGAGADPSEVQETLTRLMEWEQDARERTITVVNKSDGGGWNFNLPSVGPIDSAKDWVIAGVAALGGSIVLGNLSN